MLDWMFTGFEKVFIILIPSFDFIKEFEIRLISIFLITCLIDKTQDFVPKISVKFLFVIFEVYIHKKKYIKCS